MLLYMALAPESKLTYKEGGPAAEARFEAGVAGFEARFLPRLRRLHLRAGALSSNPRLSLGLAF